MTISGAQQTVAVMDDIAKYLPTGMTLTGFATLLSNFKGTIRAGKEGLQDVRKLLGQSKDVYNEAAELTEDSLNLLRDALLSSSPSDTTNKKRTKAIVVEPEAKKTKYKVHSGPQPQCSKKTLRDVNSSHRPAVGSELIPSLHTNQLTSVVLNRQNTLGHHDPIHNFLANLMQSGQTVSQWSGIIRAQSKLVGKDSQGVRTTICQNFRHRFSTNREIDFDNYELNNDDYPTAYGTVLLPNVPAFTFPEGTGGSIDSSAIYNHKPYENCWAPLNRPDLEDMCWNLNKLKLGTPIVTDFEESFQDGVPYFQFNRHRRQSVIEINNLNPSKIDVPSSTFNQPQYRYEAVLKGGHVTYKFMNKDSTGARVEVIVYRMKKNAQSSADCTDYVANDPVTTVPGDTSANANPLCNIVPPILQGFQDKYIGKLGTENLAGQAFAPLNGFDKGAVFNNPEYPLLPHFKTTRQTTLAYKEISRTAIALPAGGTRDVTVKFDGVKYDPADIYKKLSVAITTSEQQLPGIMDEYSYAIAISVCGVKMSRLVTDKNASDELVSDALFDVHSSAKVMYTAEYVENLGAAAYKKPGKVNLMNNAIQRDIVVANNTNTTVDAVTTIPVEKAARLTNLGPQQPGATQYVS